MFEVDQPEVLAWKEQRLDGAEPKCTRVAVPIDLREDWPAALAAHGFDRRAPTTWLMDGLLPYLEAPVVHALLARVDHLAAPGSVLLMDILGAHILTSPRLRPMLEFVASLGAPWIFGTDDPAALVAPLGWDVTVHDLASLAIPLGRWPYPPAPPGTKGVPRSFLLEAVKRG